MRAREYVGSNQDGSQVLRVDHLRATRHPDHNIRQRWAQHQIPRGARHAAVALVRLDLLALRPADHTVVLDHTCVRLERPARMEGDEIPAVLPVDKEDALTCGECPRSEERRVGKERRSRWSPY